MRKPLGIQKCDLPTYRPTDLPTDRHGKVQSRVSATKNERMGGRQTGIEKDSRRRWADRQMQEETEAKESKEIRVVRDP